MSQRLLKSLGAVLLVVGFVWSCQLQAGVVLAGARPGLRVLLDRLDAEPDRSYSKGEVEKLGRQAVGAQAHSVPWFGVPGGVMLLGGLLVFWSARSRGGGRSA